MVRIRMTSYTRARQKTQDYAHKELGIGVNRPSFEQVHLKTIYRELGNMLELSGYASC